MHYFTPDQAVLCAAFLRVLRRTGNVSLAAKQAGGHRYTLQRWRKRFPDFATEWDAAIAFAEARLLKKGAVTPQGDATLTSGGEYTVRATRGRRIQVRRAKAGLLTAAGERTFLAHLAATANVRMSAEATGIGWSAIYARRRASPWFAQEMDAALAEGLDRLEMALVANALSSMSLEAKERGNWPDMLGDVPEPLQRMSIHDVLMLMSVRRKHMVEGQYQGFRMPMPTPEETNAALERALDAVEKRAARRKAREG